MRLLKLAAMLSMLIGAAAAAPVDPATEQDLLRLYNSYKAALVAGKFDAASALMSAELRARYKSETRTEKQRRDALAMARDMMPDTVTVVHSFIDDKSLHARLVTQATKTVPKGKQIKGAPPPGTVLRGGLTLAFVKEAGIWHFDQQTFGADPTEVLACKSESNDAPADYADGAEVSAGGPVVRVEFKPDYTLVVFSVVGEANCAFLPARDALTKSGLKTELLVPYAIVSIEGTRHNSDPQKILVDKMDVTSEE